MPFRALRSRAWPAWIQILAGGAVVAAGLTSVLALQQAATARKAWPTLRATLDRLATDGGARDIWARNPALRSDYEDEAAFLATVQTWRSRVGALPDREPTTGAHWQRAAGPWSFEALARGGGGAWIHLAVQQSTPLHTAEGEGLSLLAFGADPTDLAAAREARRLRCLDADWQRLRTVASHLATPEGTKALWMKERSVQWAFPSPESLEARAQRLRPRLQSLPASAREAGPSLGVSRTRGPFLDHTEVSWVADGHALLQTEWENGALTGLVVP